MSDDDFETKSQRFQIRLEPTLKAKIERLGRLWGPFEPLSDAAVVRRCIELAFAAHLAEAKGRKK